MNRMRRIIAFTAAAAVILAAWTMTIVRINAPETGDDVAGYLELAEKQFAAGAYGSAISLYRRAISAEDSPGLRLKLANAWKAYGSPINYRNELTELIRTYPGFVEAYELLAEYYHENGDYSDCCAVVRKANKKGIGSPRLESLYQRSAYRFEILDEEFDEAGKFVNGYAKVKRDGKTYFAGSSLNVIEPGGFDCADVFFGNTAAVSVEGKSFFIDKYGKKFMVTDENYTELYSFSDGRAAIRLGERYGYIDIFGRPLPIAFEYASTFYKGISAVCDEHGWYLIDTEGAPLFEDRYEQIRLDDKNTIGSGSVCLVKLNGYYHMLDLKRKLLSPVPFEDCKAPADDGPVAVMLNGAWGFADISGEICIEPTYEDAVTFSCGLAAVKQDGLWGFIDRAGRTAIDFRFEGAGSFSDNGMAPVKVEGKWRFIRLKYRESLNERF